MVSWSDFVDYFFLGPMNDEILIHSPSLLSDLKFLVTCENNFYVTVQIWILRFKDWRYK